MYFGIVDSPVGELLLVGSKRRLAQLSFLSGRKRPAKIDSNWIRRDDEFASVKQQLNDYFCGERTRFDVPLEFSSTSNFNQDVWRALLEIPYGQTATYKDIAEAVNRPKAYRAVGQANNRNPISIIIPCHRVIGHDGTLTGFGGGLGTKQYLLDLELKTATPPSSPEINLATYREAIG